MPLSFSPFAIPLWIFLVVYGAFMAFFLLYVLFNLYHLLRFGTYGMGLYAVIILFTVGTAGILLASFALLSPLDWNATISLNDIFGSTSGSSYFPAN